MNCQEVRQHWMLYLDSEGDAELHFRISDHLGMCPECAEWFAKQERLEHLLTERLRDGPASDELWGRVLQRGGLAPRSPARPRQRGTWAVLGLAAAGVAAVLALLLWRGLVREPRGRPAPSLARLTIDCHERHLQGLSPVEFHSRDGPAVERFFQRHVGFPVHCPLGPQAAFIPSGAGVCRWAPRPMAYIVGRVDETAVSIFVLDRASLDIFPQDRDRLRHAGERYRDHEGDYQLVSRVTEDSVVVVVGTAPPDALERLINAYEDRK